MPRTCTICPHFLREAIERELIECTSTLRNIAERHSTSPPTRLRHWYDCMPTHIREAVQQRRDVVSAEAAMDAIRTQENWLQEAAEMARKNSESPGRSHERGQRDAEDARNPLWPLGREVLDRCAREGVAGVEYAAKS